jgi:hypothetical protein
MNRQSWFVVACVALFLHGGFCLVQCRRIKAEAENLPWMTCEELLRNGPRGNHFITLTDVRLCSRGYAFHRDMDAGMKMYLPIYSARLAQEPQPRELVLLLEILDDRDRDRLLGRPDVGELTCEIWTPIDSLDPWVREALAAKYPGIKLANCRVLSVGLHEPTVIKADRAWWYGIVSFLIGITILGSLIWFSPRTRIKAIMADSAPAPQRKGESL